jgi:hypothetical protein
MGFFLDEGMIPKCLIDGINVYCTVGEDVEPEQPGLSTGAIVGIIIAIILFKLMVVLCAMLLMYVTTIHCTNKHTVSDVISLKRT